MAGARVRRVRITGGCLCGAIRYLASAAPTDAHYCHCRICQRAVGNAFAIFAEFPTDKFRFVTGRLRYYRSSPIARRGFCPRCGTPILFEHPGGATIGITIGSMDHPAHVRPIIHWGSESELPWLQIADGLQHKHTLDDPEVAQRWASLKRSPLKPGVKSHS
ncbi:MAG: GFA family protein [Candidatus Binataceae bacterium]